MKHLILSMAAMALLVNCTNTKSTTSSTPQPEVKVEVQQVRPQEINDQVAAITDTVIQTYDSLAISTNIVWNDSLFVVAPPYGGWGEWPPYEPWPITIDPGIYWVTSCIWVGFDTLEENRAIRKDHFTSGQNCYNVTPNESGAAFQMEVFEEEIVTISSFQFGDCASHLPLNLSWINTPLLMREGTKSIQLNYLKHYELDIQLDFIGQLGEESIQILS